jgi:hypothetical protein
MEGKEKKIEKTRKEPLSKYSCASFLYHVSVGQGSYLFFFYKNVFHVDLTSTDLTANQPI